MGWLSVAKRNKVNISNSGLDALATFSFDSNHLEKKTFLTQKMLSRGFLAANVFYPSIAHTDDLIQKYLDALDDIFYQLGKMEENELSKALAGRICHGGFKRIN